MSVYKQIEIALKQQQTVALCTITATKGSTPRKVGTKMLVYETGNIFGTVGGGNLEKKVIENALIQLKKKEAKLFKHDLLHQHNMCCGGNIEIFIEPILKINKLYIFGAGHTGKALAELASKLDFEIFIIDDRQEYINQIIASNKVNRINTSYTEILKSLPFDDNTFITILTYEHSIDREILAFCINKPHAYLGMIGSKRKVELTKKMFLDANIASEEKLQNVKMPIGKNIKAETPEEIAISVLAEIIEIKNK